MYEYEAEVMRVVDGDTIDVIFDMGMEIMFGNVRKPKRLRLYGINTPETFGVKKDSEEYAAGKKATEWLKERIEGKTVVIRTVQDKTGKYGRYLATVMLGGVNLNLEMVKLGLAVEYMK
jgi:micrococcal nuclease